MAQAGGGFPGQPRSGGAGPARLRPVQHPAGRFALISANVLQARQRRIMPAAAAPLLRLTPCTLLLLRLLCHTGPCRSEGRIARSGWSAMWWPPPATCWQRPGSSRRAELLRACPACCCLLARRGGPPLLSLLPRPDPLSHIAAGAGGARLGRQPLLVNSCIQPCCLHSCMRSVGCGAPAAHLRRPRLAPRQLQPSIPCAAPLSPSSLLSRQDGGGRAGAGALAAGHHLRASSKVLPEESGCQPGPAQLVHPGKLALLAFLSHAVPASPAAPAVPRSCSCAAAPRCTPPPPSPRSPCPLPPPPQAFQVPWLPEAVMALGDYAALEQGLLVPPMGVATLGAITEEARLPSLAAAGRRAAAVLEPCARCCPRAPRRLHDSLPPAPLSLLLRSSQQDLERYKQGWGRPGALTAGVNYYRRAVWLLRLLRLLRRLMPALSPLASLTRQCRQPSPPAAPMLPLPTPQVHAGLSVHEPPPAGVAGAAGPAGGAHAAAVGGGRCRARAAGAPRSLTLPARGCHGSNAAAAARRGACRARSPHAHAASASAPP